MKTLVCFGIDAHLIHLKSVMLAMCVQREYCFILCNISYALVCPIPLGENLPNKDLKLCVDSLSHVVPK